MTREAENIEGKESRQHRAPNKGESYTIILMQAQKNNETMWKCNKQSKENITNSNRPGSCEMCFD